jgi:16S rRNA (guanine966-N2)-methyltransferase
MTRIVAGAAKGRRLAVPPRGTRPTSERAREALFNSLRSLVELEGAAVADLFAGSGAVGLEALSRGARSVDLVESDSGACQVLRRNVEAVALPGARVHRRPVAALLARPPSELDTAPYDLVFADPPYAVTGEAVAKMLALLSAGWLADGALVVVERATRSGPFDWPPGYAEGKSRRYGEATFWYGWYGSGAEAGQAAQPRASGPGLSLDAPQRAHEE